ncbi:MAG: Holliday junction resolvase RuvX [Pseudomonadota bacterium]|nr:Holliday junction resolvase RuvX [Pseudomonadota bacterium]
MIRVVLGFDYGKRRTGLAVGNRSTGTVTPLRTITSVGGAPDWKAIEKTILEWSPDALVVGEPRGEAQLRGANNAILAEIGRFRRGLGKRYGLPVFTVDETLSSDEAYHQLRIRRRAGNHRAIRRGDIDKIAAALLLETWMNTEPNPDPESPQ